METSHHRFRTLSNVLGRFRKIWKAQKLRLSGVIQLSIKVDWTRVSSVFTDKNLSTEGRRTWGLYLKKN